MNNYFRIPYHVDGSFGLFPNDGTWVIEVDYPDIAGDSSVEFKRYDGFSYLYCYKANEATMFFNAVAEIERVLAVPTED